MMHRVVVTRSSDQASRLSDRLRAEGLDPFEVPLITVRVSDDHRSQLREAVQRLETFEWVALTSPNAVAAFAEAVSDAGIVPVNSFPLVAVVGPGTAEAAAERGWNPALLAATASGQGLLEAMRSLEPSSVLCPLAAAARVTLPEGLRTLGWTVTQVVAYETVPLQPSAETLDEAMACDAIAFASSSSVEAWCAATAGLTVTPPLVVSIGPQTSATARDRGVRITAEANPHTLDGLAQAVANALRGK